MDNVFSPRWAHDLARDFNPLTVEGRVAAVGGGRVEIEDRLGRLEIGARVTIETTGSPLLAEVVGLGDETASALSFETLDGVRRGARAVFSANAPSVRPSRHWLGRVVDGLGRPIDGKGPIIPGAVARRLRARPAPAALRGRLGAPVDFGVKALNAFTPARAGQRLGVFAAAGVGKSMLLSMIAEHTACDVLIVALIGERGREVREFVEDSLGPERFARSIVVAATSDEPAMMRREAAFLAMTLAEHFRDDAADGCGHVLMLMDSLTRVASAQREIGLAAGEPPAARGYTPSVFALLPQLLERVGPGDAARGGTATGVFSVLVEGDDHDEPVADAARAALDGHVVLDRRIAERGRFPAIDILKSVSRTASKLLGEDEAASVRQARALEGAYDDMREMIKIGAYRPGGNEEIDRAIAFHDNFEKFLTQDLDTHVSRESTFCALYAALRALNEHDGNGSEHVGEAG